MWSDFLYECTGGNLLKKLIGNYFTIGIDWNWFLRKENVSNDFSYNNTLQLYGMNELKMFLLYECIRKYFTKWFTLYECIGKNIITGIHYKCFFFCRNGLELIFTSGIHWRCHLSYRKKMNDYRHRSSSVTLDVTKDR